MSNRVVAIFFLASAAVVGWMTGGDWRKGTAALPRTGWVVERHYDPALFRAFTGFDGLMLTMMIFAATMLVLR